MILYLHLVFVENQRVFQSSSVIAITVQCIWSCFKTKTKKKGQKSMVTGAKFSSAVDTAGLLV